LLLIEFILTKNRPQAPKGDVKNCEWDYHQPERK